MQSIEEEPTGVSRRDVLRRGAILGGALVWTVPAVQTLSGPAFATGTAPCDISSTTTVNGNTERIDYQATPGCCECVSVTTAELGGGRGAQSAAVALCAIGFVIAGERCLPEGLPTS